MVKKKSGELRFCCDFRPLNEVTIKDAYALPRIDESLARLCNAKIYTSIDLAWAFWQIPLRKPDRHKTAFACEFGLFEWRRMPFGLCNASATFQRAIARALQKIVNRKGSMVMAYIDDIVIATETVEDHMARLREVFECLREAGFKMRVAKCDFMKETRNQISGTRSLRRRRQTGPEGCCQTARLGHPSQQDRDAKFFVIR